MEKNLHKCNSDTDLNKQAVLDAIENLANVHPSFSDVFENLGVLVADVYDICSAKSKQEFIKQKSDARRVLKYFRRRLDNLTFKKGPCWKH